MTAKNAFETQLLDKLPAVAQVEPLQCVGAMLDASARVYAFRVDNTHGECFTVRTTFDESMLFYFYFPSNKNFWKIGNCFEDEPDILIKNVLYD